MNCSCASRDSQTSNTTQPPGFSAPAWNSSPGGQSPRPVCVSIPSLALTASYCARPTELENQTFSHAIKFQIVAAADRRYSLMVAGRVKSAIPTCDLTPDARTDLPPDGADQRTRRACPRAP
jgi:hypothetical protein